MSIWSNEERVELLKTLWLKGTSASEIAKRLGHGITRNAVISKANRMRLEPHNAVIRAENHRHDTKRRFPPAKAKPAPKPAFVPPKVSAVTGVRYAGPVEPREPFVTPPKADAFKPLPGTTPAEFGTPHRCKWPIDGYAQPMCCGLRLADSRYCETHVQMSGGPAPTNAKQLARSLRWAA